MNSNQTYQRFAKFYDAYVAGFTKDLPLYGSYCAPENHILEIGCGTGRVLKFLADKGCTVTGVDISEEMLEIAAQKLQNEIKNNLVILKNFNFENGYLQDEFDRVLITFYTANYLLDETKMVRFLSNIYQSMSENGIFLLDLFYPKPLAKPETEGKIFEAKIEVEGKQVLYQDCRKMDGAIEIREQKYGFYGEIIEITTHRKYYSKQRMTNLLKFTGFRQIEVTDGYDIKSFHKILDFEKTCESFIVKAVK
jgi:SAM-dependent methyltransferase